MSRLVTEPSGEDAGSGNSCTLTGVIESDQNGQAASSPLQFGSDCDPEDRSLAMEKPFTSPSVSQTCACNDLKGHHVPRVTTKELFVDDMHSAELASNDSHEASSDSILDDKIIVSFYHNDPDNPYNWTRGKKLFVVTAGIFSVLNSALGSSLPSGAIVFMIPYFKVTNEEQFELPISLFLVGYVLGPMFFAPLSETYGRKIIILSSFILFTVFTLACAVAPTWPALLVFRLVAGVNASSIIAIIGGLFADIYDDPTTRGRANAFCMAVSILPFLDKNTSLMTLRLRLWDHSYHPSSRDSSLL
ncbi:hypothetical protein MMC22_003704 [Lobaria immixta]|nr:hypothetical protein [Lobaria immixta]